MKFDLKEIDLKNIDLKDPKIRTAALATLLAIIFAFVYLYFIFFPQIFKDARMLGKAIKIRRDLRDARLLIADMDNLKKKALEFNEKIELYEKKLPAEQEIPNLLENLSKMAKNANISIIGITPVATQDIKGYKEKKGQIYKETPILITAKSGYHELGRFINNLENGDRFMKVVDINIKANPTEPKKHDVELMVYTYVLPAER